MLSLASNTRIFVAAGATDMRKGFHGLQGIVTSHLEHDPVVCFCLSIVAATNSRSSIGTETVWRSGTSGLSKAPFKCQRSPKTKSPPNFTAKN